MGASHTQFCYRSRGRFDQSARPVRHPHRWWDPLRFAATAPRVDHACRRPGHKRCTPERVHEGAHCRRCHRCATGQKRWAEIPTLTILTDEVESLLPPSVVAVAVAVADCCSSDPSSDCPRNLRTGIGVDDDARCSCCCCCCWCCCCCDGPDRVDDTSSGSPSRQTSRNDRATNTTNVMGKSRKRAVRFLFAGITAAVASIVAMVGMVLLLSSSLV